MTRRAPIRGCFSLLAAGGLALGVPRAMAQNTAFEEPQWLRLRVLETSAEVQAEAVNENVHLTGDNSTHDYQTLTPLLGLRLQGSVYHPNLFFFDINGQAGWGWTHDTVTSPGLNQTRNESRDVFRGIAQANILSGKPYNASAFYAQDHTYQNYDFFNTATVDTRRYGGNVAWTIGALSLSADAGYRNERSESLSGTAELADTYLNFIGIHQRLHGRTMFTVNYDDFSNTLNSTNTQTSLNRAVGLSDAETFGSQQQISTTAAASYSEYSYFAQQTDVLNANGVLTVNHSPTLDSFCNLNFDRSTLDPVTSSLFQGMAGVHHKLYASLNSTFEVHGNYDENSSQYGAATQSRYGVGLHENYVKNLVPWGRLSCGGSIVADHNDQSSSGVLRAPVAVNEPHKLYLLSDVNYRPAYLNNPLVFRATIQVQTPAGIHARENIDYEVIASGALTEIRLIPGSLVLHNGDTVWVTYAYFQSATPYSASYDSLNANVQVRVDFFNIFGVYGRLNWLDNNAPPEVITETLTDLVGGADATWRWLRAGAEYENYDSNFTQYDAWRFFQTYSSQPVEGTTIAAELNQIFYRYPDNRSETQYRFLAHINTQLTRWLFWNVEGGYFMQNVFGTDQNQTAARTSLTFTRGKLSLGVGYQYNYYITTQPTVTETRERNFFYANLKRTF